MPGESEASEMPVEEGTYGYTQPRRLTGESLEGAAAGTETVDVPAGSYTAEHVRYGGADPYNWTAALVASGTGATSQLGVSY